MYVVFVLYIFQANHQAVTYVYSSLFCLAGLMHTFILLRGLLASWSQAVRDKEFLVEMRLKNHEPTKESKSKMIAPTHGPVQQEKDQGQEAENIVQVNRDV